MVDVNRIHPQQKSHRPLKNGKNSRNVRKKITATRTPHKTSRLRDHGNHQTPRRRGGTAPAALSPSLELLGLIIGDGGKTSMHDDERGSESGSCNGNELYAGGIS